MPYSQIERRQTVIKQFAGATIWSEDLNNLLPFYRDVLGVKVTDVSPEYGYAMLGNETPESAGLGLGTHSEVHGRNADPARHMVGFESDDLQADVKRLKDAGVEFIEEPTEYGEMAIATLKDPEGNFVQLFQLRAG
jgi:predicted enzyme related to lactoylglutathione lyase